MFSVVSFPAFTISLGSNVTFRTNYNKSRDIMTNEPSLTAVVGVARGGNHCWIEVACSTPFKPELTIRM